MNEFFCRRWFDIFFVDREILLHSLGGISKFKDKKLKSRS